MVAPISRSAAPARLLAEGPGVLGELGLAGGVAPQQAEAVGVLAGHRQHRADGEAAAGRRGSTPATNSSAQPVRHPVEHGPVELLLGVEVAVDDQLG